MKIGQEITIKENKFIVGLNDEVIEIKANDKAIITKYGVRYLDGYAKGKINISDKSKIKGYDVDNISKRIVNTLIDNFSYMFEEYMEDYDVNRKDLEEIVHDELNEYI